MRNKDRNYEDFFDAVVMAVIDTSYTNEHAANLLVEILMSVGNSKEYIEEGPSE